MSSIKELKNQLQNLFQSAQQALSFAKNSEELYQLKTLHIGSKSGFQKMMKIMKDLKPEEKPVFGKWVNEYKLELENTYSSLFQKLKNKELVEQIKSETIDFSLPGPAPHKGGQHPIQLIIEKTITIFKSLGYGVQGGPVIESDWNNFQALNIPVDHPSRDLQDTFYIDETHVLRTHTSPIQVRSMLEKKPPMAVLAPGKVFRRDNDISHSPTFHQIEGMFIDTHVSMSHLKGTLSYFVKELFGSSTRVRFRPSYFPFTEPSAEYDCSCPICSMKGCSMCKKSGWMEIGGCGLMHPKVLELSHISPEKWEGFAFGLGIERLAIIYYGIPHIRLFLENDIRFLEQFSSKGGL